MPAVLERAHIADTDARMGGRIHELAAAIARTFSWLQVAAITALSILPAEFRPVTPAPSFLEHFTVFLLTGMAFCFGYQDRKVVVSVFLPLFAGIIEFAQLWIPGRHSRLSDLLVNIAGALIGIATIAFISKLWPILAGSVVPRFVALFAMRAQRS
jgi:VanZ family protein